MKTMLTFSVSRSCFRKWINFYVSLVLLFSISTAQAQTGTASSPFTSLGQAQNISTEGVYYFNLTGTTFSTYVKLGGWVQVAIDFASSTGGAMPQQTALTNSSRGILTPTVLAKFVSGTKARIFVSTGQLDVQNSNATIMSRIVNNQALQKGGNDNSINTWTGTNLLSASFSAGGCNASTNIGLHQRVIHVACNGNGVHWIPFDNMRQIRNNLGEIASGNYFQLLVQAPFVAVVNGPTITTQPSNLAQVICIGSSATTLSVSATSATTISYQWYSNTSASTSGGIIIAGATSSTYAPPTNSAGVKYYYVVLTNTQGSTTSAVSGAVTVSPVSVGGTASSNQTICSGTQPANITLSGNTGTIQWQVSTDNISFSNISGATTGTLTSAQMGALTTTRYYRAMVTSGACSSVYSTVVAITVTPLPTISSTTPSSLCGSGSIALGATAASGVLNWYAAASGGVSLGTGTSFSTPSISTTTTYYVDVTENGCTSTRTAVIATINALPMAASNAPSSLSLEVLAVGAGGGGGGGDGPLGAGGGSGSAVTTSFVVSSGNYTVSIGGGGIGGTGCVSNGGAGTGGANGGGNGGKAGVGGCSGGGGGGGGWSGVKLGATTYVIAGGGSGGGGSNEGSANNVDSPGGNSSPNGNTGTNTGGNGSNYSGDGGGGGGGGGGYLGGNGQTNLTGNGKASGGSSYVNPSNTANSIINGNSGKSQPNGSAGGASVSATNAANFGYSNNKGAGAAGSANNGASNNGTAGIVIIRYAGTPLATGGTITQSGGYTIHTFTSSGTFAFSGSASSASVPNVTSCGASAVTFTGTVSAGLTLDWYDAATGGNLLSQGTTTFTTPVISTTTTYYVAVRNTTTGCVSATRLAVTATINSASTVTPNQTICIGATPANIAVSSASGTIQWQSSTNNSTFTNISGQTGATLTGATIGALYSTMYYRAVITNGACVGNSPVHTITVSNPTISATPVSTDLMWTGKVSTDWTNVSNWLSYNGTTYGVAAAIPSNTTNVFIQGTSACVLNQPTIATAAGYSKNITIETGATLTMNTGSLTVKGNWTNNGTFVAGTGSVMFNGTVAQTIAGNGTTSFTNLTINNSFTGLTLNTPVEVTNTLTMTAGNIATTATNLLTLGVGSVGTLNWTSGTIVGPFKRWFAASTNTGNTSGLFPVGTVTNNRWALLQYSTAPTTAGYLSAEFKAINPATTTAGTNGLTLVDQWNWQLDNLTTDGYWEIIPTTIDGGSYDLTLRPNAFSSIGNTIDVCRIIKSPNAHTTWTLDGMHGTTSGAQADFTISRTGMSGFSYFAIAYPTAAPLPVELISFQANCIYNNGVAVTWSTASEHNSANFTVEKSRDGYNWLPLAQVEGAGNSTTILTYEIVDADNANGTIYYRLTQFDFDGASETFNIASVNCGSNDLFESINVYPNPSSDEFYIDFTNSTKEEQIVLTMIDSQGNIIFSEVKNCEKGSNTIHLKNLHVAPGIYIIEFRIGETIRRVKHSIR